MIDLSIIVDSAVDLLAEAESGLAGLYVLLSNMPDAPLEALEPVQLMQLLSPSLDRLRMALDALQHDPERRRSPGRWSAGRALRNKPPPIPP
jgi:hypothetical protein